MISALARAAAAFDAPEFLARRPRRLRLRLEPFARRPRAPRPFLARGPRRRVGHARRLRRARPRRARVVRGDRRAGLSRRRDLGCPRSSGPVRGADGALYLTAEDASDAPAIRPRIAHDGATPSGVGLIAEVFARLYHLTDEAAWRESAERLIRAFAGAGPQELAQSPLLLAAADMLERGGCVAVEGPLEDPLARALAQAALAAPDPALTVLRLDRALWPSGAPGGRPAPPSPPAAMLCRGQTCGLPARTVEALREQLERLN